MDVCLISDQQSSDLHAEKCGDSTDFICCFCDISDRKRRNNYTLIFGHFWFPEMGIKGAAIGTLTARSLEFLIVLFYVAKIDKKVRVFDGGLLRGTFTAENRKLCRDFIKVSTPVILSGLVWAISIPMQTAILGHLSSERLQQIL